MTAKAGRLTVDIVREGEAWASVLPDDAPVIATAEAAFAAGCDRSGARCRRLAAVTIALSNDASVRALNAAYRGLDKPTNVLSFPSGVTAAQLPPGEPVPLGDIILALETVQREAAGLGIAIADHVRHLVVHGTLHLLGYDHESDAEAEAMESLETTILASMGVADPYGA